MTQKTKKAAPKTIKTKKKSATRKTAAKKPAKAVRAKSGTVKTVRAKKPVDKIVAKKATTESPIETPKPRMIPSAAPPIVPATVEPKVAVKPKDEAPATQEASIAPSRAQAVEVQVKAKKITVRPPVVVKDFALQLELRPAELIARLIKMGVFANINQSIDYGIAEKIAVELGFELEQLKYTVSHSEKRPMAVGAKLVARPPIVTFMGHVDHGKTSLLDAIRKSKIVAKESGGITQHIGAYEVFLSKGAVTFLDTPGHEAFTAMRARGARVTDIVVVVVAANDGIKPQTEEAIDHAKAADATVVVAINKVDLPSANVDRVKKQLMERGLTPEDWGGKTIVQEVSAKTGQGIDALLDSLLLEAEMLELKVDREAKAEGVVIEARLSKGTGPVATAVIQAGTLRVGDVLICGMHYGKVRSMVNDQGKRVKEAIPSMPVEISGLSGVPQAGDTLQVVSSETAARKFLFDKKLELEQKAASHHAHIRLEDLYAEIRMGHIQTLNLILKSDVQGSVEALRNVIGQIESKEVQLRIIHTGIGNINKSDAMLAVASNAIIFGFHVKVETDADELIKVEDVDVRIYPVIYRVREAIERAIQGLMTPEKEEISLGTAEIRQIFKISKSGIVAGSFVTKGAVVRNQSYRIQRDGEKVSEGKIIGLKRFKDDAREVKQGFECGISLSNPEGIKSGDVIQVFEVRMKEIV